MRLGIRPRLRGSGGPGFFMVASIALVAVTACKPESDDGLAQRRASIEKELARLAPLVESRAAAFNEVEVRLKALAASADEDLPDLKQKIDDLIDRGRAAFAEAASAALDELAAEVDRELGPELAKAEDPAARLEKLEARLGAVPRAFAEAESTRLEALRRRVVKQRSLATHLRGLLVKAQRMEEAGLYENARGLLEGFSLVESYKSSPFADRAAAALKEMEQRRAAGGGVEDKGWKVLYRLAGDLGAFTVINSTVFRTERRQLVAENDGGGEASLRVVGEGWKNYIVEFEFQIKRGGFTLGVRLSDDLRDFDAIPFTTSDFPPPTYYRVRVKVSGETARVLTLPSFDARSVPLGQAAGDVFFGFEPDSEVRFRSIRIKQLP